jgi:hypothetical protein
LHAALAGYMDPGKDLSVRLTDNRQTIIAVRRSPSLCKVRVHRIFTRAKPPILAALGHYIARDDHAAALLLKAFIEQHEDEIIQVPAKPRIPRLQPKGRHHDLQQIFDTLNATYFESALSAKITWGARPAPRKRQSIKVGSYVVEDGLIRIHPALDQREVPPLFVAWVVFHEMLHAKHPVTVEGNRRCFHSPAFLAEEKRFVGHQAALAWQARNLARLLDS